MDNPGIPGNSNSSAGNEPTKAEATPISGTFEKTAQAICNDPSIEAETHFTPPEVKALIQTEQFDDNFRHYLYATRGQIFDDEYFGLYMLREDMAKKYLAADHREGGDEFWQKQIALDQHMSAAKMLGQENEVVAAAWVAQADTTDRLRHQNGRYNELKTLSMDRATEKDGTSMPDTMLSTREPPRTSEKLTTAQEPAGREVIQSVGATEDRQRQGAATAAQEPIEKGQIKGQAGESGLQPDQTTRDEASNNTPGKFAQPLSPHERWRQQTQARIDWERQYKNGSPKPSQDPEFEKQLDAKQAVREARFKSQFGEEAERPESWRNKERQILMMRLSAKDENKELFHLDHSQTALYRDKLSREAARNPKNDKGAEP